MRGTDKRIELKMSVEKTRPVHMVLARMSGATRVAIAGALAVGFALVAAWNWLPGGQNLLPLDAAYVQEAQRLGRAVGEATFKDFDPSKIAFLIIKKGGQNYLVNYSGKEKLPGKKLVVNGMAALHLHKPVITIDVATVLPVRPNFLRQAADTAIFTVPAWEMAAVAMGRTSLSGRFASELQVHDFSAGQEGLLQAVAGPRIADESVPSDLYVTFLVHEAFHVYQWDRLRLWMQKMHENYSDGNEKDDVPLKRAYKDQQVQELQRQEGKWLSRALEATDRESIVRYAREFLRVRAARRQRMEHILGPDAAYAIELECLQEWTEGLARYIEIRAWQIGSAPGYHPTGALLSDPAFHGYRAGQSRTGIRWGAEELIDEVGQGSAGSEAWYTLGSGQALVLDRLNVPWHSEAMGPVPLEDLLTKWVGATSLLWVTAVSNK
ncbi:MAG: hypothetical protein HPY52_14660 [Firmicutes bacterium]|nr:hypothetical protein [Bacillota bacterium]